MSQYSEYLFKLFGSGIGELLDENSGTFENYIDSSFAQYNWGSFGFYYLSEKLERVILIEDEQTKVTTKIEPYTILQSPIKLTKTGNRYEIPEESRQIFNSEFITEFKEDLRNNIVAREIFDTTIQFETQSGRFAVGGSSKSFRKQVNVTRTSTRLLDSQQWTEEITAVIKSKNLCQGGNTLFSVKNKLDPHMLPGDEYGHIIAKVLGGPGDTVANFIPMTEDLNRSLYVGWELRIRNELIKNKKNKDFAAKVKVILHYDLSKYDQKIRPFKLERTIEFIPTEYQSFKN